VFDVADPDPALGLSNTTTTKMPRTASVASIISDMKSALPGYVLDSLPQRREAKKEAVG
jgi:hypothetical protein